MSSKKFSLKIVILLIITKLFILINLTIFTENKCIEYKKKTTYSAQNHNQQQQQLLLLNKDMWWKTVCSKYGPYKTKLWHEEHAYDYELDKYHDVIRKSIGRSNITLRGIRQRDYLSLVADAYLILYELKGELNEQINTVDIWLFELCNDSGDTDYPNWKSQVLTRGLDENYHILIN